MKMKRGFTLLEILVVITLLVILAVVLILLFNPLVQINKANDSKRKTELSTMKKVLEDWYNDKNCFPKPVEICFPSSQQDYNPAINNRCYFCGNDPNSPSLSPYLNQIPCDPNHPAKNYLYEVDNNQCPSTYWIYTNLSNKNDSDIKTLSCQNGCGPAGDCNFNYGVTSSNTFVQYCTLPTPTPYYVGSCPTYYPLYVIINNVCNICGSYNECLGSYPNKIFYTDAGGGGVTGCTQACIKTGPVASPTPTIFIPTPTTYYVGSCSSYSTFYFLNNNGCNICGNYNDCQASHPNNTFYVNPSCNQACIKN